MLILALAAFLTALAADKPDQPKMLLIAKLVRLVSGIVGLFNLAWLIAGL